MRLLYRKNVINSDLDKLY